MAETPRKAVFLAIDQERQYPEGKWGTNAQHPHEVGAWLTIMRTMLGRAEIAWMGPDHTYALDEIRQLAAVAVAAMEQHGAPIRFDPRQLPESQSELVDNYQTWVNDFIMTAGLGVESGEVLELLKKHVRDGVTRLPGVFHSLTSMRALISAPPPR